MVRENPTVKLSDITEPDQWINVDCQVINEIQSPAESIAQKVWIADHTTAIEAVLWAKAARAGVPRLKVGKSYHLENVVTNEFRGRFSIALVSSTRVTEIPDMGLDEELY